MQHSVLLKKNADMHHQEEINHVNDHDLSIADDTNYND